MNQILDKNKRYRYDGKQDVWVECDDLIPSVIRLIPSVIRLPAPLPKPPKAINYLKDNIMTTNTQNTVTENSLFSEFISADIGYWIKPSDKVKFKPIKVNDYDVIFTRNNIGSLKDCFDYLKLHGDIKGSLTKPFNDKCLEKKVIFIDTDTLLPITDVESLINGYSRCEIEISNISVSGVINNLKKDKKMNGDQIAKYLNNTINECYNLALEFYAIGEVNKPVTSLENDKLTTDNYTSIFEVLGSKTFTVDTFENYLLPDIFPKGELIQLIADPKIGKTLFAYDLIGSIVNGEDFLGYEIKEENKQVLLIQLDETRTTCETRLFQRIGTNYCENIRVAYEWQLSDQGLKILESSITKFKPTLVVIDSLRASLTGTGIDENNAAIGDYLLKLRNILSKHNTSAIFIHHSNKNRENKGTSRSRGSSAIAAACHSTWLLTNGKDDTIKLDITGRCKSKNFDLLLDEDTLHFTVTENEEEVTSEPLTDDLPITKKLKNQLPDLVSQGINTVNDLTNKTGCNKNTVRKALNELVKDGKLIRIGNGRPKPSYYQLKQADQLTDHLADQSGSLDGSIKNNVRSSITAVNDLNDPEPITPIPDKDQLTGSIETIQKPKLEIINNETTKSQYSGQTIQLTVELQKVYDAVVQSSKDDYESIQVFELSMKYLDSCDLTKLKNDLEQLVTLGLLYKPWPDEYALAF